MIKILINEEEVVSNKEISIDEEMLSTSSTILNNCYPASWEDTKDYISNFYYPKDYSKCKIFKDDKLIFCGVVKNSGDISLNPRYPKYCSLQILDFKTLLSEGETLDFVINQKTITEAIEMVIDEIKDYGFIKGNIDIFGADDIIGAYSTQDKTAYDVFQYIADITGARWYTRMVDENTLAIDFYDPTLLPRGKNLQYNTTFFEEQNIQDLSFSYGSRDYRNKQIMQSDEVYANISYNETIECNGTSNTFEVSANIGYINSVKYLGAIDLEVTTKENKELGIDADIYYTPGKNQIETEKTYENGNWLVIDYVPIVKGRQIVYNNDEVDRISTQTGRKGIITRYETRNDVLSSAELDAIGQSYIKYKGSAEVTLNLVTEDNDLYNVGQIVYFESPINDLAQDYMVKKKTTKIIASVDKIFYTYELTSSFNSEKEINWFDNQRNKVKGNISEGETITRNIDIETSTQIVFNNFSSEEISITNDNVLDCSLESPFIK